MYITGCLNSNSVLLVRITKAKYQNASCREQLRARVQQRSGRTVKFVVYDRNIMLPISEYLCQNIKWSRFNLRQLE